jgi:DNA-binding HxlR family transcriptional regulator
MLKEEGRRKKEEVIIAMVSAIEKVLRRLGGCYKSVILSEAKNLGDSSLRSE